MHTYFIQILTKNYLKIARSIKCFLFNHYLSKKWQSKSLVCQTLLTFSIQNCYFWVRNHWLKLTYFQFWNTQSFLFHIFQQDMTHFTNEPPILTEKWFCITFQTCTLLHELGRSTSHFWKHLQKIVVYLQMNTNSATGLSTSTDTNFFTTHNKWPYVLKSLLHS